MPTIAFAIGRFLLAIVLGLLPALAPIIVGILVEKLNSRFGRRKGEGNMVGIVISAILTTLVLGYLFGYLASWTQVALPPYGGNLFFGFVLASLTWTASFVMVRTLTLQQRIRVLEGKYYGSEEE